jgi:hypothetical protein
MAMAILVLAVGSPTAAADPIAYFAATLSSGESGLLRMDLSNGEVTEVGPFGPGSVTTALAFAPDGTLYGMALDVGGGARLVTVDPATGAATLVTELILTDPFGVFGAMTVDACGRLFAGGLMGVLGGELRDKLVAVDPTTGTIRELASGPEGLGPSALAARGETLFTVRLNVLSILDPATGGITPIGGTSVPGLDFDFAADGYLWGAIGQAPIPVPGPSGSTWRIDPQTGEVEGVAQHGQSMYGGLAIGPPPGMCGATLLAIPAVSPPGLAVLALLLAVGGTILARRQTVR